MGDASRLDRRSLLKAAATVTTGGLVALKTAEVEAATATKLEGYADLTSVKPGGAIRFFVHNGLARNAKSTATLTISRVAHPSDVVVHTATVTVAGQTTPANAWANGCNWAQTLAFAVPPAWPSGLYNAVFSAGSLRAVVPFVVKPTAPGAVARVVCQVPFTTLQAYNDWGGKSLYEFRSSGGVRSYKVSFDRPHANAEYGDLYQWVHPFIRYAQRRGVAVDYVSSVDLHADPTVLDPYQLFVTVGHDEYWSRAMRERLDAFVTDGGNALILSGNTCYWQIRFDPSPTGAANRVVTCYKDWNADPIADVNLKTVEWEEFGPSYKRALGTYSQHATIGLGFERGGVWSAATPRPATPFVVHRPDHWAFAGTGLTRGATFGGDIVGYETDAVRYTMVDGLPVPTGTDGAPSNLSILGIADLASWAAAGQRGGEAVMSIHRNNGTVLNVGTIDWSKGLTGPTSTVERITDNAIQMLGAPKSPRNRAVQAMYQYHAVDPDGGWRFVFSPSPFLTQKNTGWTYDGSTFWVFQAPPAGVAGVVPIKQYHWVSPEGQWSVRYQIDATPPPVGWVDDGVAYYAYGTPGPDREPVYQYHAPSPGTIDRVVYTGDPDLGLGWTLDGLAFYSPDWPATLND
ncbi:MAG: hypothetical protein K1X38_04425 [Microthrixaceae bacterium]|nr:hypothetical protein [Microthrixaceae bacterium]